MRCKGTNNEICGNNIAHMMFSKSADGGTTWSPPRLMATVTMNWTLPNTKGERVYNYPVIAVDNSDGSHAGNLYVAMYTWTGTYLRVQVIRSTDGGTTWSKPVPVAPATDTHDQFFPSLSVSPTGKVGVSWLDRRNDPKNVDYQAFAAISTDGGKTFPNTQLTKAFSDPDTNGTGNNWMGDYTGNTWAGGKFIVAWMDSSNGVDMQEVIGGVRLK
jgi:Neuraminidase (sialidase)